MGQDLYVELVNKLGTIKEFKLANSPQSEALADLMRKYDIKNLPDVDRLVRQFYMRSRPSVQESAHTQVTSEFLLVLITPAVISLRGYIFGSFEAPFKNNEEYMHWLAKQLYGGVEGHGLLYFLLTKAAEISRITNFTTWSIVEYIVLNLEPVFHKMVLHEHIDVGEEPVFKKSIQNAWLSVHFFEDLSFKDMVKLHKSIREFFGSRRGKAFTKKHAELYRMVSRRGRLPAKGVVSFWESIREEWNKEHKEGQRYETWKGAKIAYERICKKLEAKYQGKREYAEDLSGQFEMPEVLRRDLRWLK